MAQVVFTPKFVVSIASQRHIFLIKMHERGSHAQNGATSGGEVTLTLAFKPQQNASRFS